MRPRWPKRSCACCAIRRCARKWARPVGRTPSARIGARSPRACGTSTPDCFADSAPQLCYACAARKSIRAHLFAFRTRLPPMHIVLLHDTLPAEQPDDAAAAVWRLGQGLIAAGHRVTFITTTPGAAQVEQRGGITVHLLHSRYATRWAAWYGLLNPQTVVPLYRTLRALKPDIVHAHNVQTHLSYHSIVLGRRVGAGTVFTARNTLPFAYRTPEISADRCAELDYRLPVLANWQHARLRWNPTRNLSIRHTMHSYTHAKIAVSDTLRQALAANRLQSFEVIHDGIERNNALPEAALAALR